MHEFKMFKRQIVLSLTAQTVSPFFHEKIAQQGRSAMGNQFSAASASWLKTTFLKAILRDSFPATIHDFPDVVLLPIAMRPEPEGFRGKRGQTV